MEDLTRRKPMSVSWRTSTSGTGNFPSPRSTTWPPATAEHRRATSSPGQRTTLKYLAEQPNGPLSLAVRTTELREKREKKEEKKKKKKGLSVFLSFRRSCLHLTFVRDDLSYLLVSLNLGFLSFFLGIYVQKNTLVDYHLEGGWGRKKNQSEKLLIVRKVTREPRCKRTRCLFLLILFLWTLS